MVTRERKDIVLSTSNKKNVKKLCKEETKSYQKSKGKKDNKGEKDKRGWKAYPKVV